MKTLLFPVIFLCFFCNPNYNVKAQTQPVDLQSLLDNGQSPISLFRSGVPLNDLYGKTYKKGLLFYLNTNTGQGLVAHTKDFPRTAGWGCDSKDVIKATNVISKPLRPDNDQQIGARIGDGKVNTEGIISTCTEIYTGYLAAFLCRKLGNEWHLPSRGELDLIYRNLYLKGNGGLSPNCYWSSTEYDKYRAWIYCFDSGIQGEIAKGRNNQKVRAIKAF